MEKIETHELQSKRDRQRENLGLVIRDASLRTICPIDIDEGLADGNTNLHLPAAERKRKHSSRSSAIDYFNQEYGNLKEEKISREKILERQFESENRFKEGQLKLETEKWEAEKFLNQQNIENEKCRISLEKDKLDLERKKIDNDSRKLDLDSLRLKAEAERESRNSKSRDAIDKAMIQAFMSFASSNKKN